MEKASDDEENDRDGLVDHVGLGHDQSQSARMLKEGCGPTRLIVSYAGRVEKHVQATYFDLQDIVSSETLVMHLMIGIVCITSRLILHKSKSA